MSIFRAYECRTDTPTHIVIFNKCWGTSEISAEEAAADAAKNYWPINGVEVASVRKEPLFLRHLYCEHQKRVSNVRYIGAYKAYPYYNRIELVFVVIEEAW